MKIIDEKGKLFGKINIIDLLVILLVVVVAAVLGIKFLGSDDDVGVYEPAAKLTYTVKVEGVERETYENVCQFVDAKAGLKDQLMASGALLNGYVVDVSAADSAAEENEGKLDLIFTVEVIPTDELSGSVGTQEVRIGKEHILKTVHFEFEEGVILTCQWGS